jgi:hypothetical protein
MASADDFPVNINGHSMADTVDTIVMGVQLYVLKPGAKAFPSIPLLTTDGLDIRVASNGQFIYFWAKKRMYAVKLEDIITGARFHLSGKTQGAPATKPARVVAPVKAAPPPQPKEEELF